MTWEKQFHCGHKGPQTDKTDFGPITDCGCPYDDRLQQGHAESCPTLKATTWPDGTPKVAPVQGWKAGIPWSLHLEAYSAYARKWRGQAALIDLDRRGCRGGFGITELDEFIPGWREKIGEIAELRQLIKELAEVLDNVLGEMGDDIHKSDEMFAASEAADAVLAKARAKL